jgi:hypothetical protein
MVSLFKDLQLDLVLLELLGVTQLLIHQNMSLALSDTSFQTPLPLSGFIEGVALTVNGNSFLVLPPKLLQLLIGILGRIDAHNDWHGRVTTVQSANAALERVVQPTELSIRVLPTLDRFMVRRTATVGRDLPTVAAKIVMVLLGYLLLHQSLRP